MDRCWQLKPSRRPTFFGILEELEGDLSQKFHEVSFYHNQDQHAGTKLEPETEGAVEYAEETVADDELIVGNTTSLLYPVTVIGSAVAAWLRATRHRSKMLEVLKMRVWSWFFMNFSGVKWCGLV